MAEIYSPIPASSQIFTSKSRPPLGQSMSVLSRHNQLSSNAAAALPQLAKVTQKRRHSDDSDDDMEPRNQSPTPEKPRVLAPARSRKLAMKKVRVEPEGSSQGKSDEQKSSEDGVDLADARILLANLPLSSYPAMIQALLEKDPSITKLLISVIPRPSADAACEAIRAATKKLRDSVPYSAAPPAASSTMRAQYTGSGGRASPLNDANNAAASTSSSTGTSTLGLNVGNFGFGSLSLNSSAIGLDFGFGSPSSSLPSTPPINAGQSHQRDAYVLSRLRPAIQEFISTVHAYLPYYSLLPAPVTLSTLQNKAPTSTKADEEKPHPNETFMVLASLTNSIISLPPKVVTALNENSSLPERLMKEWEAWLTYLDDSVNLKGEMFSGDQARSWINALDAFAVGAASSSASGFGFGGNTGFGSFGAASMGFGGSTTGLSGWRAPSSSASLGGWGALASTPNPPVTSDTSHNLPEIKKFRDEWINRVGWLVGRQPPVGGFEAMDEL